MSRLTAVPEFGSVRAAPPSATALAGPVADTTRTFRAMASEVTVRISPGARGADRAVDAAAELFAAVERECTRFDPDSALMRANAAGDSWCPVGDFCYRAVVEAAQAHERTGGLFDPRVLRSLLALGYDRSLPFEDRRVDVRAGAEPPPGPPASPWRPGLEPAGPAVRIGPVPIDLGGIGKGLAVRWASEIVGATCPSFFVEAGGDCYFAGRGPAGDGWQVGVEDPRGGEAPVAVLTLSDAACATSSTRIRTWTVGGRPAHHLIDPRTGEPSLGGLLSVTVVDRDPAAAEIWSKVLFLRGRDGIAAAAAAQEVAAVWVDDRGALGTSRAAARHVIWQPA